MMLQLSNKPLQLNFEDRFLATSFIRTHQCFKWMLKDLFKLTKIQPDLHTYPIHCWEPWLKHANYSKVCVFTRLLFLSTIFVVFTECSNLQLLFKSILHFQFDHLKAQLNFLIDVLSFPVSLFTNWHAGGVKLPFATSALIEDAQWTQRTQNWTTSIETQLRNTNEWRQ